MLSESTVLSTVILLDCLLHFCYVLHTSPMCKANTDTLMSMMSLQVVTPFRYLIYPERSKLLLVNFFTHIVQLSTYNKFLLFASQYFKIFNRVIYSLYSILYHIFSIPLTYYLFVERVI